VISALVKKFYLLQTIIYIASGKLDGCDLDRLSAFTGGKKGESPTMRNYAEQQHFSPPPHLFTQQVRRPNTL